MPLPYINLWAKVSLKRRRKYRRTLVQSIARAPEEDTEILVTVKTIRIKHIVFDHGRKFGKKKATSLVDKLLTEEEKPIKGTLEETFRIFFVY
jgi:hypothetical protein